MVGGDRKSSPRWRQKLGGAGAGSLPLIQVDTGPASPAAAGNEGTRRPLRSLLMMDKDVRSLSQATRAHN